MVDIPDIPQRSHTLHGGYPAAMDQIQPGGSWGPSSGPGFLGGERQVPRVLSQSSECLRWNAALATRTDCQWPGNPGEPAWYPAW